MNWRDAFLKVVAAIKADLLDHERDEHKSCPCECGGRQWQFDAIRTAESLNQTYTQALGRADRRAA